MNKQDFIDWKHHPVTKMVFSQLANRVKSIQEVLGDTAGETPMQDRFLVGTIQAYKDVLLMEFEEDDDESQ